MSGSVAGTSRAADASRADRSAASLRWERHAPAGIGYAAQWRRVGSEFHPPLGVALRRGVTAWSGALAYGRRSGARTERTALVVDAVRSHARDAWESAAAEARWERGREAGTRTTVSVAARREDLAADYRLYHGGVFAPGVYRFVEGGVTVVTPPARRVGASLRLVGGGFFDGRRITATLHPSWRPVPRLVLAADVEANRVWVPRRGGRFRGDVLRLWLHGSVGPHTSLHGFVQVSGGHRARAVNARLQHTIHPGGELWLVLTDGAADDPLNRHRWPWTQRELLLKYSHRVALTSRTDRT